MGSSGLDGGSQVDKDDRRNADADSEASDVNNRISTRRLRSCGVNMALAEEARKVVTKCKQNRPMTFNKKAVDRLLEDENVTESELLLEEYQLLISFYLDLHMRKPIQGIVLTPDKRSRLIEFLKMKLVDLRKEARELGVTLPPPTHLEIGLTSWQRERMRLEKTVPSLRDKSVVRRYRSDRSITPQRYSSPASGGTRSASLISTRSARHSQPTPSHSRSSARIELAAWAEKLPMQTRPRKQLFQAPKSVHSWLAKYTSDTDKDWIGKLRR